MFCFAIYPWDVEEDEFAIFIFPIKYNDDVDYCNELENVFNSIDGEFFNICESIFTHSLDGKSFTYWFDVFIKEGWQPDFGYCQIEDLLDLIEEDVVNMNLQYLKELKNIFPTKEDIEIIEDVESEIKDYLDYLL